MTITDRKREDTTTNLNVFLALTPEEQSQESTITPQECYQQGMQDIWEKIHCLPRGQDQVVMSQIWWYGKSSTSPSPKEFPALATHGFILEEPVGEQVFCEPYSPYLKDFWRIGIDVSLAYGFRLRPYPAFQASLSAIMHMIFN
ncbi:MAG TPA: hypothetical protein VFA09_08020 [Ktedonobacteraceae bacterium]|jgi:hypothetical protein|nr:hypothetical protein [Ktedonobacteraceae bacterium]